MSIKDFGKQDRTDVPSYVRRHLTSQPKSGLSIPQYCKRHSFSAWSFYQWRKRYQDKLTGEPRTPVSFTDLGVLRATGTVCDIRFPSGVTVSVNRGVTIEEMDSVLRLVSTGIRC